MLQPQAHISAQECERGIRFLMIDAAAATAIGALNSGVVLLALALHIGASTIAIGYLAAIPLLTQVLQAPMVKLVERVRVPADDRRALDGFAQAQSGEAQRV